MASDDAEQDMSCADAGHPLVGSHPDGGYVCACGEVGPAAGDVAHDKPGVADPCWPHIPHQPAGAALEDAIRDALDWIPGEGRDQADCIADAVRHYQANASGSATYAPEDVTALHVAAREVLAYEPPAGQAGGGKFAQALARLREAVEDYAAYPSQGVER